MTASPFPDWLHERSVTDHAFASAYEALSDVMRSCLKLCISQLYDHCRSQVAATGGCRATTLQHASGLAASIRQEPAPWCLVVLDQDFVSAPRLLATVLPPLVAGVRHLQVVRLAARKAPWPPALLAALELAGVEQVAQTPAQQFQALLEHLQKTGAFGSILAPQPLPTLSQQAWLTLAQASCWRFWQPRFVGQAGESALERTKERTKGRAGVFAADATGLPWKLLILAWCQPDLAVELWYEDGSPLAEPPAALPPAWTVRRGDATVFLQQQYDLVLAPPHMHQAALRTAPLVLGPGEESCWLWPDLQPCVFQQSAAAWKFLRDAPEYPEYPLPVSQASEPADGSPGA